MREMWFCSFVEPCLEMFKQWFYYDTRGEAIKAFKNHFKEKPQGICLYCIKMGDKYKTISIIPETLFPAQFLVELGNYYGGELLMNTKTGSIGTAYNCAHNVIDSLKTDPDIDVVEDFMSLVKVCSQCRCEKCECKD